MKLNKKLIAISLACVISSGKSFAGGYATGLTSTAGLANSYAGSVTGIHDASDMFFNPATLTSVKNWEMVMSANYKNFTANPQGASNASGVSRGNNIKDAGVNSFVSAHYFTKRLNEDSVLGLAITTPFGAYSRYDQTWQGFDRANKTSIDSKNINPSLAYQLTDKLSLGAGLQAQYLNVTFTGMTSTGGGNYTPNDMHASSWAFGYNLGAKYQVNDKLKLGAGYRSKIAHRLTGTAQVQGVAYSDIDANVTTPESFTAGAAYKYAKDVELAYDVTWTRWSRINSSTITASQSSTLNSSLQRPRSQQWNNSIMHSVGANFMLNDKWLLRTGAAYEKETNTSIRIPTADKYWVSFGFNYKISKTFALDGAYMHQFYKNGRVNYSQTSTADSFVSNYNISVDVFSLGFRKTF